VKFLTEKRLEEECNKKKKSYKVNKEGKKRKTN
jgi:hypothetical protein